VKQAIRNIDPQTADFLRLRFRKIKTVDEANNEMRRLSCIQIFFPSQQGFDLFLNFIVSTAEVAEMDTRREYGDFQTPQSLSDLVCTLIRSQRIAPSILVEPTFGRGAFIVSAIRAFPTLEEIHGVEIYEPYCWHTKFAILETFIKNPELNRPMIHLFRDDVFKFDFSELAKSFKDRTVLVLGNPPWVTNSELSSLNSSNVPVKRNFKSLNGLDAITGKGNFDIGEYIILSMLGTFETLKGSLAMLAKNSVIKNVIQDLPRTNHPISDLAAFTFDAKFYFNASVEASLFTCNFREDQSSPTCKVASLQHPETSDARFGWVDGKFVSDVDNYQDVKVFDNTSPFVWRQGVKHDCSKILELELSEGGYRNRLNEKVDIEDDLVFPLVKSSDIQNGVVVSHRKFVIITQKKVGDDTAYIADKYPRLHRYLSDNVKYFADRKSSIYNGKSPFAIFGIGDYSFKPFKVAISGLYKKPKFSLIQPHNGKPVMLDDTCYFLGFQDRTPAVFALLTLNSDTVQTLLSSLAFSDAKRPYTKDVLMRVNICQVGESIGFQKILDLASQLPQEIHDTLVKEKWNEFLKSGDKVSEPVSQVSLFE